LLLSTARRKLGTVRNLITCLLVSISPLVASPSITLPLAFERNLGQTDLQVKYLTRGQGGTVWFTEQGPVLGVMERSAEKSRETSPRITSRTTARMAVLRMRFEGGKRAPKIEGVNQTGGVSNYFIGNDPSKWRTDVPQFEQVRYRDVYPGIDVVFYGNDRNLEYDFVLQPGADPSRIRLSFDGPGTLSKDSNGDLVLKIGDTEIRNHKPVIRQAGRTVDGEYKLSGKRTARFAVGPYDRSRALVIDPVMTYATLVGGSGGDQASQVAMDAQGNLYMVGTTTSTNFPLKNALFTSLGSFQGVYYHAFVTKINPSLSGAASVVFSTLFGGSLGDQGSAIGVDGSGNVVIAGGTTSPDIPLMNPFSSVPPQTTCIDSTNGEPAVCIEAFVTKFSAAGNTLVFSTYLGTANNYAPSVIAVDASGNAWMAGATSDPFLAIRGNSFQTSAPATILGTLVGFVTEFNPAGSLIYSTYFAGESGSQVFAIAPDTSGNVVIGGVTKSLRLPTTQGALLTANPANPLYGSETGFVAKLNPNVAGAAGLLYGTYLGGGATDNVYAVAVDSSGNLYAGGSADSLSFPVTANALRTVGVDIYGLFSGEGFVTKLNPAATGTAQLVYSTFFGGSGDDEVLGLAVDPAGRVVVTGVTNSPDLFTTPDAFQCCFAGYVNPFVTQLGFLARLDPAKSGSASLLYATYLGGTFLTLLDSLALDSTGNNVAVGGWVDSPDTPVTLSAFQSKYGGDGTLPPTAPQSFAHLYQGDAYIANFNFAIATGPVVTLYENGGGLSAIPAATIAPGLVFTVKGTFPGPSTASLAAIDPSTGRLATILEGVQVLVDGIACPLTYVSTTQINAIAPYELASNANPLASVQVVVSNVPGNIVFEPVAPTAPGILSFDDGTGQGAIVNQDGTINGSSNAAARGTIVTIYATGEGQTTPAGIDGGLATNLNALPHPIAPLSLTIGGVAATNIAYAGTAPDEVYGLLQINVTVPAGVTPGSAVPVVLTVGGVSSQAGLTMAVQ
jgi:uncharacterized protein (TIGR03437 family)